MGKTTLMALMATCPLIDTVKIKGRSRSSLDAFTAWLGETFPRITTVQTVDTIEEVVRGSDIVTYCNSGATGDPSTYPLVKREWVKPGTFLVMPALCNIDEGMEREDVRKVVDNAGLYEAWFEELPKPAHNVVPIIGVKFMDMIHQGKMRRDRLEDIGPIVAGKPWPPQRRGDHHHVGRRYACRGRRLGHGGLPQRSGTRHRRLAQPLGPAGPALKPAFRERHMTTITKIKTGSKFEEIGSYSRLVAVDKWIYVSNTAGRNAQSGQIPEDVIEQTDQVFANIEAALASVGSGLGDVIASRVFIQDPADTHAVMTRVGEKFRGIDPASTVTCPPLGSTVYKVEIEVTAYRGAATATTERRTITL
jgi:enamine deaminase RidA (YjgF/YER057c/UK114 family)